MKFTAIDSGAYASIKQDWLERLKAVEHEVFLADFHQLFELIEKDEAYGDIDSRFNVPIHYGVVDAGGHCHALVQIVQSKRGKEVWVKMLDIFLSPKIELLPDNQKSTSLRLEVFKESLKGIFALTSANKLADTIKVYGRSDALITFLRGMHDAFSVIDSLGTIQGIEVSIEGRWLVFRAI